MIVAAHDKRDHEKKLRAVHWQLRLAFGAWPELYKAMRETTTDLIYRMQEVDSVAEEYRALDVPRALIPVETDGRDMPREQQAWGQCGDRRSAASKTSSLKTTF